MRARAATAYAIRDPDALRQIVRQVIAELGGGNEQGAARLLRISQPTLNRLRNKKRRTLASRTMRALYRATLRLGNGEEISRKLLEAVLNPRAATVLDGHVAWIGTRLGRFARRRGPQWYYDVAPSRRLYDFHGSSHAPDELEELIRRMKTETPREWARLDKTFRAHRVQPHRARISAVRIFEPFFDHAGSHFVERGANELTATEFRHFVRAGVTREILLLKCAPTPWRALQIARGLIPPEPDDAYRTVLWGAGIRGANEALAKGHYPPEA